MMGPDCSEAESGGHAFVQRHRAQPVPRIAPLGERLGKKEGKAEPKHPCALRAIFAAECPPMRGFGIFFDREAMITEGSS
jgi:hypothetical protein